MSEYPQDSTFYPVPKDETLATGCIAAALGPAGTNDHLSLVVGPRTQVQLWKVYRLRDAVFVRQAAPEPYMYHVDQAALPSRGRIVPIVWSGARVRPEWPVWFEKKQGDVGVNLVDAMRGGPLSLQGQRLIRMFAHECHACVSWPGYYEYNRKFSVTMIRETVTADELLYHLAWAVHAMLSGKAVHDLTRLAPPGLEVGVVRPEDVTIVGALNLAQGKWYPILRVAHRLR
ncbi:hypothetical protein FA95DRAFT_1574544 [Auriscalpium vulgare]|uniref:Uncharacterized protein n=1 Tax=Auriscalpium vulgare TaxID=40419 RepID=A0ACB8RK36_9AGAM|nr:hypothetical protein FA95DRAFT_1574544 [Auriscalpium vulgare]